MLLKNRIKRDNGITLVALVITILILLILVGISISQLAGYLKNQDKQKKKQKNHKI